jgi:hypothetical protein
VESQAVSRAVIDHASCIATPIKTIITPIKSPFKRRESSPWSDQTAGPVFEEALLRGKRLAEIISHTREPTKSTQIPKISHETLWILIDLTVTVIVKAITRFIVAETIHLFTDPWIDHGRGTGPLASIRRITISVVPIRQAVTHLTCEIIIT